MFNARSTLHGPTRTGRGHRACGAAGSRGYPLGGGAGYREVVRPTGSPVRHLDELLEALASARAGDTVYVAGDAVGRGTRTRPRTCAGTRAASAGPCTAPSGAPGRR